MAGDATIEITIQLNDQAMAGFRQAMDDLQKGAKGVSVGVTGAGKAAGDAADKAGKKWIAFGKPIHEINTRFKQVSHTLFSLRNVLVTTLGGLFVKQLFETARATDNAEGAFRNLSKAAGFDAKEGLDALRKSVRGTASDMDLMAVANKALMLRSASTIEDLTAMADAGRKLGRAMGRDATEGFNDLAVGIARQSMPILDNLGIIVRSEDAYRKYAETVGKTAERLSDSEKRAAFRQAALEAINLRMKMLGKDTDTTADKINRLYASMSNAWTMAVKHLTPALLSLAKRLQEIVPIAAGVAEELEYVAEWWGIIASREEQSAEAIEKARRIESAQRQFGRESPEELVVYIKAQKDAIRDLTSERRMLLDVEGLDAQAARMQMIYAAKRIPEIEKEIQKTIILRDVLMGLAAQREKAAAQFLSVAHPAGLGAARPAAGPRFPGWPVESMGVTQESVGDIKSYVDEQKRQVEEWKEWLGLTEQFRAEGGWEELVPDDRQLTVGERWLEVQKQLNLEMKTAQEVMDPETAREWLQLRDEMFEQALDLNRATAEQGDLLEKMWGGAYDAMLKYEYTVRDVFQNTSQAVMDSLTAMQDTMSTVIFDAMMGELKSWKEYLKNFLRDIARALSNLASQMIAMGIIKGIGGAIAGAFGGAITTGNVAGGFENVSTPVSGAAIPLHQAGGVFSRPHLARIAEAGPEAVIPLRHGRVPVEMSGSAGEVHIHNHWNIQTIDSTTFAGWLASPDSKRVLDARMAQALHGDLGVRREARGTR